MPNKIQIKRGIFVDLPILDSGEPAFCTDNKHLYIGDGLNNYLINYTHPTYPGDDFSVDTTVLTGAVVVSEIDINVTTDVSGHVIDTNGVVATRTLTLANLGYTGHAVATANGTVTGSGTTSGTNTGDQINISGSAASFTEDLAGDVTGPQTATVVSDDSHIHTTSTITNLSGTNTGDNTVCTSGTATTATKLFTARTIDITGDITATAVSFDGSANISISAVVNDDSHDHVIANVDGLQSALDAKATPANISTAITNLVDSSPATMDTLNELAAALGDDPSFATTVTTSIGTKLAKSSNLIDLANTSTARTNLGVDVAGTINYSHPTYTGDDFSVDTGALTGATVVSDIDINVTTDASGHVTDTNGSISTRTLTLANLGYTGSVTANNYTHPTYTARTESGDTGALTGATVISDLDFNITTDTKGHVTACDITTLSTRTLTLANLGYTGSTTANNYSLSVASATLGGVKSGTDITVDGSGNVTLNTIDGGEI